VHLSVRGFSQVRWIVVGGGNSTNGLSGGAPLPFAARAVLRGPRCSFGLDFNSLDFNSIDAENATLTVRREGYPGAIPLMPMCRATR
jgi:hypothetical protein